MKLFDKHGVEVREFAVLKIFHYIGARKKKGKDMDLKRMRACAPLLPSPGGDIVCECLDEIERLRAALVDVAESKPLTATPAQMIHALQSMARDALTPTQKSCHE